MARGKYAARSANRRSVEAQESLAQLQDRFAEFRKQSARREAHLRDELERTKNRLVHEVDALAMTAVRRAEMRVEEVRAEEREAARQRVIAGMTTMRDGAAAKLDELEVLANAADAFGVPLSDVLLKPEGATDSRDARRRMRTSEVRKGFSLAQQVRSMSPKHLTNASEVHRAMNEIKAHDRGECAHG